MDCPVCKLPERDVTSRAVGDRYEVTCARCGTYAISGTAVAMCSTRPANFALSGWLRDASEASRSASVSSATLEQVAGEGKKLTVSEKQLKLMRALEARNDVPGTKLHMVPEFDFVLAGCSSTRELEFILRALIDRGLLNLADYEDPADSFSLEVMITAAGWAFLEAHVKPSSAANTAPSTAAPAQATSAQWDVFVSHASEDKDAFARPLAEALRAKGLRVWFDGFTLTVGDSLRQSIDRGLSQSRFGVVVLSTAFFQKRWPQLELDGLVAREAQGSKVVLPVWYDVDEPVVRAHSPLLADRVAISSDQGIESVVHALIDAMGAK